MKNYVKYLFTFAFIFSISALVISLHSWHQVEYVVSNKEVFKKLLSKNKDTYGVLHFLTPTCSCSEEIYKHLLEVGPNKKKDVKEIVFLIDDKKKRFFNPLKEKVSRLY